MPEPRAEAAAEALLYDREIRRLSAHRQKAIDAEYERRTGYEVPISVPFLDDEGNQWELQVHVTLRLVKRSDGEGQTLG